MITPTTVRIQVRSSMASLHSHFHLPHSHCHPLFMWKQYGLLFTFFFHFFHSHTHSYTFSVSSSKLSTFQVQHAVWPPGHVFVILICILLIFCPFSYSLLSASQVQYAVWPPGHFASSSFSFFFSSTRPTLSDATQISGQPR